MFFVIFVARNAIADIINIYNMMWLEKLGNLYNFGLNNPSSNSPCIWAE